MPSLTPGAPLFEATGARIDVDGVPAIEQLTAKTTGNNVVVLGAPRAVFEACAGIRSVTSGVLRVEGASPRDAAASATVASAPVDVPVPPRWTVRELARQSAILAGHPRREIDPRAGAALKALGLDTMARTKLGGADLAVRRAAMVAAALATGARTLLVEDFTAGLADAAARSLGRLFVTACKDRRWMLFAGKLALSSPLGLNADEALLFKAGRLVLSGNPAEIAAKERTFSVRLSAANGASATFAGALRERGASVATSGEGTVTVTLPEGLSPLDLIRLARTQNLVVLELLPVSDALV